MKRLRGTWRIFWSRRSRARIALTCILVAATVLLIVWLEVPEEWRRVIQSGIATVAGWVGSLDATTLLVALIIVSVLALLALLFVPSYRHFPYLVTAPSLIPSVSVYLDAENQLSEATIRSFMEYLNKYLDGRRADLLYFLDASVSATTSKYKTLYRAGFRPIDVPHNPTGQGRIGEAVDREIAMHAFERALLGPSNQEFIIVSRDGDYVPLIYRLVALGHRVQVWALTPANAYDVVADYLGVNVINLANVLTELRNIPAASGDNVLSAAPAKVPARPVSKRSKPSRQRPFRGIFATSGRSALPPSLTMSGEAKLFYAIEDSVTAHAISVQKSHADRRRDLLFHSALGTVLTPRLSGIGYSVGAARIDYWIEHLIAARIFKIDAGTRFPERDGATAETASRRLYAMVALTARVAADVASRHANGAIDMTEVADALAALPASEDALAEPLARLLIRANPKRTTHARYFVRSARALGLLQFNDVPGNLDALSHVRLSAAASMHPGARPETKAKDADIPPLDGSAGETGDMPPTL